MNLVKKIFTKEFWKNCEKKLEKIKKTRPVIFVLICILFVILIFLLICVSVLLNLLLF